MEENELYGQHTDYYQYDQDNYDTKVTDYNYMYDDHDDEYEYDD